jgi:hypothetical protein
MDRFNDGQRVKISDVAHPLKGKTGVVERKRTDGQAWIHMDEPIPAEHRSFTPPDPRAQNIVLAPEQCEAAE